MALQNRSTVLAIVPETTEGTPVSPSAATQFLAIQEDFSIDPAFDTLENAELKASLGVAKPIIGKENPSANFAHYLRHSGVEGTAPNFKELIEAAFGTEVVASTQYDTVASSTTTVVKVDTGEGAQFQRGQVLLVKDPNGYSLRPVLSVSGDNLTLGFALPSAPAASVNLGKAILYKPANSGHQTLSLWAYRSNGGAIEMVAGARVTEMGIEIAAGDLINASFAMEGIAYYFDPIEILSADTKLDFLDNATTRAATIAADFYKDPHELSQAIADAMNELGSANTFSVSYSNSTGKYTIASTGSTLSLLFATGSNVANSIHDKLGFTGTDKTGALTYTGTNPITITAPYTPTYDSSDPIAAKNNEVFIGDSADTSCIGASKVSFKLANAKADIDTICAETGRAGTLITKREVSVSVTSLLSQYDAEKFKRYRLGTSVQFLYNFGVKLADSWVAGKCGAIYMPTAVISACKVSVQDGLCILELELKAYVDSSGNGEVYLNFL